MSQTEKTRYSESELKEFEALILDKIEKANIDSYFERIINRELMDDYFSSEDLLDQTHHHQVFQSKGFPQV